MANLNRRAALIGAVVSTAALAVPATSALAEDPYTRVRRIQKDLSRALAELAAHGGQANDFVSIVYPADTVPYTRSLVERDIFEDTRIREVRRSQAVYEWQQCVEARDGATSRGEWEALNAYAQDAMKAMHEALAA